MRKVITYMRVFHYLFSLVEIVVVIVVVVVVVVEVVVAAASAAEFSFHKS